MKKLILKITAFLLLSLLVTSLLSHYLDDFFVNRYRSDKEFWIMNQKNGKYDFAVIGSSRACNTVNVSEMERVTNWKGINIAVSGTNYAGNFLMLKRFLSCNNTMRILLVQVDIFGLDSKHSFSDPFVVRNYLPYLDVDHDIDCVVRDNSPGYRYMLWKYLPFGKYAEFNTEYMKCFARHYRKSTEALLWKNKGYMPVEESRGIFELKSCYKMIDAVDYDYLTRIIELAKKNHIEVVLFTSPQYHEIKKAIKTYGTFSDVVAFISGKYGVSYLDFGSGGMCDDKRYFADLTHTNSEGSRKFSALLAESIAALKRD